MNPSCKLLFIISTLVGSGMAAPTPRDILDIPQFLATHGGFSFYKVFIEPTLYRANQQVTDEVVASTCLAASRGTPPMAPCQSSSPACKFYSDIHCKATSEQGCEQPMLTTALAMGCSSAYDPSCRLRTEGSLVGTNGGGCLWAHMGLNWNGNGACGNCYCNVPTWNPASPTATCDAMGQFCQEGRLFSADGTVWPECIQAVVPGTTQVSCLTNINPAGDWPDTAAEHWAYCVGRAVCKCVHGKCDIASELGHCRLGTCGPGWSGMLCNEPCGPTFCLGRNDPNAIPPTNIVASPYRGVWTNLQNQCHCQCLPQYGPSGAGPQGTICGSCIQPGMLQCVAYTGTYLSSTTPVNSIPRNTQFTVNVDARFVQNDQVDTSITEIITVSKNAGGGNGDGGTLNVHTQNSQMNQGQVTMVMEFTDACDACYLTFADVKGILQPLTFGPIRVTTSSTHLQATTSHTTVGVTDTVVVRLQAVDGPVGSPGSVDVTSPGVIRASLQTVPDGGNGGGCGVTPDTSSSLTQSLTNGVGEWRFRFGCACDACVIVFEDMSQTRTLPTFYYQPIKVITNGQTLGCRTDIGAECVSVSLKRREEVFSIAIRALDSQGNLDRSTTGTITLNLAGGGGNGNGGQLLNAAGTKSLTQPLVDGEALYDLSFTEACDNCVVTASSSNTALASYTFPSIRVYTDGLNLAVINNPPTQLSVGQVFEVIVEARDSQNNRDTNWNGNVGANLLANGGNGNGGQLLYEDNSNSLVRTLINGVYTFRLKFTASCTACIVEFTDVSSSNQRLNPVQIAPIFVGTSGVKMELVDPLRGGIRKGQTFTMNIRVVDGLNNIDVADNGRIAASQVPGGGNGGGGDLTDPLGLTRTLVSGQASFNMIYSKACDACYIEIQHNSGNIPVLTVGPITVTSSATQLIIVSSIPSTVRVGEAAFDLIVQAVDDDRSLDTSPRGTLSLRIQSGGGNGNGGVLTNAGTPALDQVTVNGQAQWRPQFSGACQQCVLVVNDISTGLGSVVTQAISVTSSVARLVASTPFNTTRVSVGTPFVVTVFTLDSNNNKATSTSTIIAASLQPNGGNGDGAPFQASPAQSTVNGEATFTIQFGGGCTACVVEFVSAGTLLSTTLPPIEVVSSGQSLEIPLGSTLANVQRGQVFDVPVTVVDSKRSVDTSWTGRVQVSLRKGGGNGDGGTLSNSGLSLTQPLERGYRLFQLSFSSACESCTLEFSDVSGVLPTTTLPAIKVSTTTSALEVTQTISGAATQQGTAFNVQVTAKDDEGYINTDDQSVVSLGLGDYGSSNGAIVTPIAGGLVGGDAKRLTDGTATYSVTVTDDCTNCAILPQYSKGASGSSDPNIAQPYRLPLHVATTPLNTTAPAPPPGPSSSDDSSIIIVAVLAVVGAILLALLAYCCWKNEYKKKKDEEVKPVPSNEAPLPPYPENNYIPAELPSNDYSTSNPIGEVFPTSPQGDRPWMVDVEDGPVH
eukprot:TRINITY_DN3938_c0_g1_i3.p1 TRINITY_DN3938_c0_g1~~TRINITY_DN3938_c0_g1_i3.p1  ORF type:complete len:1474 (+),score=300.16 TRINITY_DN3938_c0_g1_i3:70-4491(+)